MCFLLFPLIYDLGIFSILGCIHFAITLNASIFEELTPEPWDQDLRFVCIFFKAHPMQTNI